MERTKLERLVMDSWPDRRLGKEIGRGGTACVYELLNERGAQTQPPEVVKVVVSDPAQGNFAKCLRGYMDQELKNMQELAYCRYTMHLLRHSMRQEGKTTLLLMAMPRCDTLEAASRQWKEAERESWYVLLLHDVACALRDCARKHILHRDVKPENVFVRRTSGGGISFILGDFGISRELPAGVARPVTHVGTPRYIAPEIHHHKPLRGFNSDLYLLGGTVWDLATGESFREMFECRNTLQMPDVSDELCTILLKLLRENPMERYEKAEDVLRDLEPLYQRALQHLGQKRRSWDDCAREAKALCLQDEWDEALHLAAEGAEAGDDASIRLHAYLLGRAYGDRRDGEAEEQMERAIKELWPLTRKGDAAAMAILATLLYDEDAPWAEMCRANPDTLLQVSAERGSALGEYLYGRRLYKTGGEREKKKGMDYIGRSAGRGYLPAMRIYRRLLKRGEFNKPQPDMVQLLDLELQDYESRLTESNLRVV